MSQKVFTKIMRGLEEAKAYDEGKRVGYTVTAFSAQDLKTIPKRLQSAQGR